MRFPSSLTVAALLGLVPTLVAAPAFAAVITPTVVTSATNTVVTPVAVAGGGDLVTNTKGGVVILVENQHATLPTTVTVTSNATNIPPGTGKTDLSIVVAAGKTAVIGPLDAGVWNNGTNQVALAYTASTTVFVAAYTH